MDVKGKMNSHALALDTNKEHICKNIQEEERRPNLERQNCCLDKWGHYRFYKAIIWNYKTFSFNN